jgi:hypothetical protein
MTFHSIKWDINTLLQNGASIIKRLATGAWKFMSVTVCLSIPLVHTYPHSHDTLFLASLSLLNSALVLL